MTDFDQYDVDMEFHAPSGLIVTANRSHVIYDFADEPAITRHSTCYLFNNQPLF